MNYNKLGEENKDKYGCVYKIVEYNSYKDIVVEFQDEHKFCVHTTYQHFLDKGIRNPYSKNIFNVASIGLLKATNNKKNIQSYTSWKGMLFRVYDKKMHETHKTYKGCSTCQDWHCYENFKIWYDNNYYELGQEKMCLDKDILLKGNKIYSPNTCIFVPNRINTLFTKSNKTRGNCPIGVFYNKKIKNYRTMYSKFNDGKSKNVNIGSFKTPEEAFYAYKQTKESYIKQVADEYKSKYPTFPQKLYDAMYRYEVEITD